MSNLPAFLEETLVAAIKAQYPLLEKFEFVHTEFEADQDGELCYVLGTAKLTFTVTQPYHSFIVKLAEQLVACDGVAVQVRQESPGKKTRFATRGVYARKGGVAEYHDWREEVLKMKMKHPVTFWAYVNLIED